MKCKRYRVTLPSWRILWRPTWIWSKSFRLLQQLKCHLCQAGKRQQGICKMGGSMCALVLQRMAPLLSTTMSKSQQRQCLQADGLAGLSRLVEAKGSLAKYVCSLMLMLQHIKSWIISTCHVFPDCKTTGVVHACCQCSRQEFSFRYTGSRSFRLMWNASPITCIQVHLYTY